ERELSGRRRFSDHAAVDLVLFETIQECQDHRSRRRRRCAEEALRARQDRSDPDGHQHAGDGWTEARFARAAERAAEGDSDHHHHDGRRGRGSGAGPRARRERVHLEADSELASDQDDLGAAGFLSGPHRDLLHSRRGTGVVIAGIVILFLVPRIALLFAREPFFDELYTRWISRKSFAAILDALHNDSGPPLYYFVVHFLPASVRAMRIVSLVCATGSLVSILSARSLGVMRFLAATMLAVF